LAGALEVKGILGSDKRKYILDLMRLSPRDLNYQGDDNLCCVLRLELVENYVMAQYIEKANEKFAVYVKEQ
jgi:protein TIF31